MEEQDITVSEEVTAFLDGKNHPLRGEIEQLRAIIMATNLGLTENVKWNGPNYSYNGQDKITMKINPPKCIQLIFHRGAKKLEQPKDKLILEDTKLLIWRENDRAIANFLNAEEIGNAQFILKGIIEKWIIATT